MEVQKRLPEMEPVIVGMTGSLGSGCTTVAEILESQLGFTKVTLSDLLVDEAKRRGIKLPEQRGKRRKQLQILGTELRQPGDHGILVRMAFKQLGKVAEQESVVMDGIKNPGELAELRKHPNAYLVAVDSSKDMRWKRVAVEDYNGFLGQFERDDEIDKDERLDYGQKVQACVDLADIMLLNDVDWGDSKRKKDEFAKKVVHYVGLLQKPGLREPTARELLMNNAYWTSLRSKCLSRRVGAVIVFQDSTTRQFYVLAAGHNHVPAGLKDCVEEYGECYRDKKRREAYEKIKYCPACGSETSDGRCSNAACGYSSADRDLLEPFSYSRGLDVCPIVHAEESAILQVSLLGGPALRGSIMFTTTFPCPLCAKMIIESGIREVVYVEAYPMKEAVEMLEQAEVQSTRFEGVKAQAFFKLFSV